MAVGPPLALVGLFGVPLPSIMAPLQVESRPNEPMIHRFLEISDPPLNPSRVPKPWRPPMGVSIFHGSVVPLRSCPGNDPLGFGLLGNFQTRFPPEPVLRKRIVTDPLLKAGSLMMFTVPVARLLSG